MTVIRILLPCRSWLSAGLAGLAVLVGSSFPQQAFAQTGADGDKLIEVRTLEQLNAIRYDLDGDGMANTATISYMAAFPSSAMSMGCQSDCEGYQLMADLDFDTSGDGEITMDDNVLSWRSGLGWQPIGTFDDLFTAEFHGNGHTISHLFIHSTGTGNAGLFGVVGDEAVIRSVGLVGVDVTVTGNSGAGGLVGDNSGVIRASYEPVGLRDNHT